MGILLNQAIHPISDDTSETMDATAFVNNNDLLHYCRKRW
jgi:hypothetical protein